MELSTSRHGIEDCITWKGSSDGVISCKGAWKK